MIENTAPADKLVLIADDHAEISDLLRTMVEELVGARAVIAGDGEEAVALAERLRPDLILLDLMMPKLDGIRALRRLKADRVTRAIPVIAVTAAGWDEERSAFAAGCIGVVSKPFDVLDLADRVQGQLVGIPGEGVFRGNQLFVQ